MSAHGAPARWGAWALGDLLDWARVVRDVFGSAGEVASVQISAPREKDGVPDLPVARIVASTVADLETLREAACASEYEVEHGFNPEPHFWSAFLGDLYVVLSVKEED
ncbi:hypothetical protein [Nocardioides daphniae]|uniref:Uncharacterized protein n=1 Tax=Nocardioides daphniae TaxID=402297 RepID=A0ABQ1Q5G4_9ACTN|nr:hypothetical protein [Nocardioides daphniae]GGD12627.1 hypothetical protein GCM10007231_09550 [Nocardioides daphniae]